MGIDASLSSTGIAIAKCSFDEQNRDYLFKLLTEKSGVSSDLLEKSFRLSFITEIKEDKETAKQLAKVRKNIRDAEKINEQPRLIDNIEEERLSTKKIHDQVYAIMSIVAQQESRTGPMFVFIEDYSYHSPGSITQLAEMKGDLKTSMADYMAVENHLDLKLPPIHYLTANINTVKKIGGRNGNANKDLMCEEIKRFGFQGDIKLDDQTDAIAIALASFYAMYHRLFVFEVPLNLKAKERNYYKTFIDSLNTFGNRIGSQDDLRKLI